MRLLVLPGDGIGPEITAAALTVLRAADTAYGLRLSLEEELIGLESLRQYGTTLREEVLEKARSHDGLILGTISHADYPPPAQGGRNVSAVFRTHLDLYANIRPARTRPFLPSNLKPGKSMDLVIVREATEGFYPDRNMAQGWGEMMPTRDLALSVRKITRQASERIARRAFELAMRRRRKVTAVHKANCFLMTDGLFLEAVREIARDFPEVTLETLLVDACTAHLVRAPERFDVLLTTNLYGDILSDLAGELTGSLGLAGSVMAGDGLCCAQAQHGSAPDIQGQDRANPTSMILSVAMLLAWLGEHHRSAPLAQAAGAIAQAVDAVLAEASSRTPDLGGPLGTRAFGDRVAAALAPP
jgi:3-isopropylmalate dehydrogenase